MSIEEIRGEEGGQGDKLKELEARLRQYEKELREAKDELKRKDEEIRLKNEEIRLKNEEINRLMQGRYRFKDEDSDEVKVKDESDIDNRKDLEERDTLIRHLNDKMNNNVKIKQMTTEYENLLADNASTDKDMQIAELVKSVYSLEKELKEQIKKSDEKLEEEQKCRETMVREIEEKLQQVQLREAANQNNNNEAMVLRLMDRFTAIEQNIQSMREETADLKIGMNQQAEAIREEIHDTQRQVSDELSEIKEVLNDTKRQVSDEVSEKMTKQMKEQGAAIRDEVQNTKQELKDEMAAKMDEQTQKINELQTDIQEVINPPLEPKEEIIYSPCEEAETPHDEKPSQCAKSSSSTNCGIDSIPAQDSRGTGTDEFV